VPWTGLGATPRQRIVTKESGNPHKAWPVCAPGALEKLHIPNGHRSPWLRGAPEIAEIIYA